LEGVFVLFKRHSVWIDIAVFAAVLSLFLFSAHKLTRKKATVTVEHSAKADLSIVERVPASRTVAAEANSVKVLDLGCLPTKEKAFKTNSKLLRVSAGVCGKQKQRIVESSGVNETNGFDIACFVDAKKQRIATNFFQLNEGINRIRLNVLWDNGKRREEMFEVVRE
jgi:hypothetical protein